jgi:hypothetical protein
MTNMPRRQGHFYEEFLNMENNSLNHLETFFVFCFEARRCQWLRRATANANGCQETAASQLMLRDPAKRPTNQKKKSLKRSVVFPPNPVSCPKPSEQ